LEEYQSKKEEVEKMQNEVDAITKEEAKLGDAEEDEASITQHKNLVLILALTPNPDARLVVKALFCGRH